MANIGKQYVSSRQGTKLGQRKSIFEPSKFPQPSSNITPSPETTDLSGYRQPQSGEMMANVMDSLSTSKSASPPNYITGKQLAIQKRQDREVNNTSVNQLKAPPRQSNLSGYSLDNKSNQPAQLKKGTKTTNHKFKYKTTATPHWSQDDVQGYLRTIAPQEGAIRDFIENHADENGGLCAGWVVLHRTKPEKLMKMWKEVSEILENTREGLGQKTDEAVKMYMEAQYHFAQDPENQDFVKPEEEILRMLNLPEEDNTQKVGSETKQVKYGEIYRNAKEFHDELKCSKKQVFIEIYTKTHTAQIEMKSGKLKSICETEKAGVKEIGDWGMAEQILTSAFFLEEDKDQDITLSFEAHVPKT
ncbi:hypothetical protein [Limnoraphis robusta]|uniref:Uncharacterized protein n=1 Tax=Limnoraphis robusta CCNP1315 TaxID=3110306 RepID=A0ABU5U312_9CYAN|nr:hypothetical protein [Limnoraphis robusta]MEA5521400.1 hypothetical protein [Limnoraphis robusta CCNP1315]MEA5547923.1 hypothetical protein [Limnoraphis robusta CCNP1324]